MRLSLRGLTSFGLSVLLVAPMLIDAGCASHSQDALNDAISTLSSSGVAIYETTTSKAPMQTVGGTQSSMRLTRWQLATLVNQNDAGMVMTGSDMDRMEGKDALKGAPTISMFVAAWLSKSTTPLSAYAKRLMGKHPFDIKKAPLEVFPLLVVTLFVADIAPLRTPRHAFENPSFNLENMIAAPALADGICSTVSDFAGGVIKDVSASLQEIPIGGGVLAFLWNHVVEAVSTVVNIALAPLLSVIKAVSAGLAAVSMVVSLLSPWTVTIKGAKDPATLVDQPVIGNFVAEVSGNGLEVPSDVADCAKQLGGVDLSDISATGAEVTWTTYNDSPGNPQPWELANVPASKGVLDEHHKATLDYTTHALPAPTPDPNCSQLVHAGQLGITATIQRIDALHAQQKLLAYLSGKLLPDFIDKHVQSIFNQWLLPAQTKVASFLKESAVGSGTVQLQEWKLNSPSTCPSSPPPQSSGQPASTSSPDNSALIGAWSCNTTVTVNNKELGPFSVSVQTAMTFDKNGTSTGTQWGGSAMSGHSIRNGPGTGFSHTGSGKYTYDASGADSGTLHVDGKDLALKFSNPKAFTTQVTSPVSHRTYDLSCKRS
jgi:hypothetical protein